MKLSNPQRIEFLQQRLATLKRLLYAGRFNPKEAQERMRELDTIEWALPILEQHAKESSERQQEIERQMAEARTRPEHRAEG